MESKLLEQLLETKRSSREEARGGWAGLGWACLRLGAGLPSISKKHYVFCKRKNGVLFDRFDESFCSKVFGWNQAKNSQNRLRWGLVWFIGIVCSLWRPINVHGVLRNLDHKFVHLSFYPCTSCSWFCSCCIVILCIKFWSCFFIYNGYMWVPIYSTYLQRHEIINEAARSLTLSFRMKDRISEGLMLLGVGLK